MRIRMIDYYVKNLSFDARQEIFGALEKIYTTSVEKMLEKEDRYPCYKSLGYSDDTIAVHLRKQSAKFQHVNELMIKYDRPPLFADPADTYVCSLRYVEIMRSYWQCESDRFPTSLRDFGKRREHVDVLVEKMGCRWEDYIPESYCQCV